MIIIIRNFFIINHGIPLLNLNFGECHSLGPNENLVSALISALDNFSNTVMGSPFETISMEGYEFFFSRETQGLELLYVMITDENEKAKKIQFKMSRIASIFKEKYAKTLENFNGDVSSFDGFKDTLIEMNLAQKNCGGRPECEGCPNSSKTHNIMNSFAENRTSFLNRFKSLFRKTNIKKL